MEWQPIEREIAGIIEREVSVTVHGPQDYEVDAAYAVPTILRTLLAHLNNPSKEMLDAGMDAIEDCKDSSWGSGCDGESYNSYEYVTSDAHLVVWRAMLKKAAQGMETATAAETASQAPSEG